jgi:hypothetical protein
MDRLSGEAEDFPIKQADKWTEISVELGVENKYKRAVQKIVHACQSLITPFQLGLWKLKLLLTLGFFCSRHALLYLPTCQDAELCKLYFL